MLNVFIVENRGWISSLLRKTLTKGKMFFVIPKTLSKIPECYLCVCTGPGRKHEELRRMIENGVRELWYFVRSEVKKLGHVDTGELQKHINMLLQDLGHHQRCLTNTHTKYMHTMHSYYWMSITI